MPSNAWLKPAPAASTGSASSPSGLPTTPARNGRRSILASSPAAAVSASPSSICWPTCRSRRAAPEDPPDTECPPSDHRGHSGLSSSGGGGPHQTGGGLGERAGGLPPRGGGFWGGNENSLAPIL